MSAATPQLERFGPLTLVGLARHYNRILETYDITQAIGGQWTDYMIRRVPPPWEQAVHRYGITMRMADGDTKFGYFCGAPPPNPPQHVDGLVEMKLPELVVAAYPFDGHILEFRAFVHTLFGTLLPQAGLEPAPDADGVPELIERYGVGFDPLTGRGGFDVLVPVAG